MACRCGASTRCAAAAAAVCAAGVRGEPDRLTRGLWDGLAAVLVGKRDVEGIWEEEIRPRLKNFASMQDGDEGPPEDSRWHANWRIPQNRIL